VFASGAYRANAIAVSGNTAYVSDGFNNQVDAVNLKTSAVTSINVGHGPTVMAPNPKATALYVLNTGDGTLGVINTSTNAVVQTVKVGPNPVGIAVNHSGKLAYVVNGGAGTVTPVKLATKSKAEKAIYVGGEPTSIAINPSNTLAFVTNLFCPISSAACNPSGGNGQESYGVVEILTLKTKPIGVECCIAVGQSPQTAAFEPTGHYLWVLNAGGNSASIIDSFTNEVTATATSSEATSQWESSSPFVFQTPF
jgi:YVTN family beta-propeller protein